MQSPDGDAEGSLGRPIDDIFRSSTQSRKGHHIYVLTPGPCWSGVSIDSATSPGGALGEGRVCGHHTCSGDTQAEKQVAGTWGHGDMEIWGPLRLCPCEAGGSLCATGCHSSGRRGREAGRTSKGYARGTQYFKQPFSPQKYLFLTPDVPDENLRTY